MNGYRQNTSRINLALIIVKEGYHSCKWKSGFATVIWTCDLLRYLFTTKRVQTLKILQISSGKQASFTVGAFKLCLINYSVGITQVDACTHPDIDISPSC